MSEPAELTTLDAVPVGTSVCVHGLEGGHEFTARMVALGLTPGTTVRVVRSSGRGPLIVLVRESRIALGRGAAQRVIVTGSVDAPR
jgi:ferrous iron transport protein A